MAEADRPIAEPGTPVTLEIENEANGKTGNRRRLALMVSVPLLIALVGAWFYLTGGRTVSTDNAYVKQDVVSISSDVNGRIVSVRVRENQMVKAGDTLFTVDPEPYRVALESANAAIATAQAKVTGLQTDLSTSAVDIEGAQSDVTFAKAEYERQQELMRSGFTTKAKLQAAQNAYQNAQWRVREAQVDAAKARAALANGAQVPGVNPAVATALAQRDKAALDLSRTRTVAPVAGRVSQSGRLQVGQMMIMGLPAVSVVASDRSWIEANFKEGQLEKMYPGQRATITFDAYPNLKLKGHVESLGAGTGSEFSVLPAQNANGNWVKVTQRVPVRIAIDDKSPRPLIAGLSAAVTVDVRQR
ncbi:HlyD family secretion protein [Sphingobium phenoxybenzoativorans]|uniref:HlyD family secretion protein n=1 Tax=Sphingobium phenoxybenzoativorans TaxID=1592790 RepID=UPI000871E3DC|nr:HlyD family secretion protein [Sphingobium phenoxybenzoativorans]